MEYDAHLDDAGLDCQHLDASAEFGGEALEWVEYGRGSDGHA